MGKEQLKQTTVTSEPAAGDTAPYESKMNVSSNDGEDGKEAAFQPSALNQPIGSLSGNKIRQALED